MVLNGLLQGLLCLYHIFLSVHYNPSLEKWDWHTRKFSENGVKLNRPSVHILVRIRKRKVGIFIVNIKYKVPRDSIKFVPTIPPTATKLHGVISDSSHHTCLLINMVLYVRHVDSSGFIVQPTLRNLGDIRIFWSLLTAGSFTHDELLLSSWSCKIPLSLLMGMGVLLGPTVPPNPESFFRIIFTQKCSGYSGTQDLRRHCPSLCDNER
jgi:hypothetical protein